MTSRFNSQPFPPTSCTYQEAPTASWCCTDIASINYSNSWDWVSSSLPAELVQPATVSTKHENEAASTREGRIRLVDPYNQYFKPMPQLFSEHFIPYTSDIPYSRNMFVLPQRTGFSSLRPFILNSVLGILSTSS